MSEQPAVPQRRKTVEEIFSDYARSAFDGEPYDNTTTVDAPPSDGQSPAEQLGIFINSHLSKSQNGAL